MQSLLSLFSVSKKSSLWIPYYQHTNKNAITSIPIEVVVTNLEGVLRGVLLLELVAAGETLCVL